MSDSPLFSFLLITYKQAQYVEEAFKACVSQTIDDYEVIISDDNSPDNTWDVLTRLVDEYRMMGGNIPIIMNRNEKNLGIGGNFQKAADLSHGTWLLMAAGDDVSLPNRLEVVKSVIDSNPNIYGINTARFFVDENGQNPQYNFALGYLLGADSVWKREIFTNFPALDKTVMSEDHVLNLRAMLLGGMAQVNSPTIKYRIGNNNYSIQRANNILDVKKAALKKMSYTRDLLLFRQKDINFWKEEHEDELIKAIERKNNKEIAETEKAIRSHQLYIETIGKDLFGRLRYIFTPSKEWLHNRLIFRIYNVMKMYAIFSEKHHSKKKDYNIQIIQDNKVYVLGVHDFLNNNIF